jgi:predicted transcriptional regulator
MSQKEAEVGRLPDLSRFEMQCLRRLWARGEASVRAICEDLDDSPSYSTVRKIFERLEEKGAIARVRMEGKAWVYRSAVPPASMIRKEIRRFLDNLFDGSAAPLVAHLAEMKEVSLEDLAEIERRLGTRVRKRGGRRRKRRAR